ncbi:MAG: hypothetical protein EXS46_02095 [Candidatus Taylorbacteria bacterium]|nr:hypothetical protein [Candidatus Taylorbacteria bacterium]
MSSYINFAKAVKVQRFTREIIARWFNKLVERDDYDRGDKRSILARLTELSNPIEDNDKQAQTASPLQD